VPKVGQTGIKGQSQTWSVYLVYCSDGSLYTGISTDPVRRLAEHNSGRGAKYTRSRLPVTLHHVETVGSLSDALKREAAIKRMHRWEKLVLGKF